jgi:signal transduction histidine kinase/CheY-like chemotaxis protein
MPALDNSQHNLSPLTGEFISSSTEAAFNADRWPLIARQIRVNSIIGAVAYLAAFSVDFFAFGYGQQTLVMAAMRLTVAFVVAIIFFSTYLGYFSAWTKALIFFSELLIGLSELIEYRYFFIDKYPFQELGTPFIVVFILIFYLIVPNQIYLTVIASFIISVLFLGFHFITLSFSFSSTTIELGLMLLAVNVFGYAVNLISSRQSRRVFLQRILLEKEIVERKLAEEEARQARMTADRANTAKSRFLAVMNHEIRTPLNGVLGGIQLLEAMPLKSEQQHTLQIISRSGAQLADLIEDVLDLAQIEAGQIQLAYKDFDLFRLLDDVKSIMTIQAEKKGLRLKLHLDNALPAVIHGVPTRLRQVLINLVGNAIKSTDTGEVLITVKNKLPTKNPILLDFSIADKGIGLSDESQKHIFEAFYQVDNSDTRAQGGNGLGLAISCSLVEAMGGRLKVMSKKGVGSRFNFALKFTLGDEKNIPKIIDELPQLSLLVVDDTEVNRHIAGGLLESLGQLVTYAESGEKAVSLAKSSRFDLVFMDLHMPGISGIEATRRIHAVQPSVPIVAMTADVLKEKIQDCLAKGMAGFIPKPVRRAELLNCLLNMSGQFNILDNKVSKVTGKLATDEVYPLLDLELIAEIKAHLGENKVAEIMAVCRHSLLSLINLSEQKQGNDKTKLNISSIHRLKGIAGNYGMVRLHQCAKRLESAITINDFEQAKLLEQEVTKLVNKSLKRWETAY